ncbi:MAG: hypothetical protein AAFW87_01685 [Pseudomonadota bacterium]
MVPLIAEGQSTEVAKMIESGGWGYLIDCPNGPPDISWLQEIAAG